MHLQRTYKMTDKEWNEIVKSNWPHRGRAKRKREPGRAIDKWRISVYASDSGKIEHHDIFAYTASEARAQVKAKLGLTRLPPGTIIQKYDAKSRVWFSTNRSRLPF